ncbi:MAG: membrane protein insertion efficiency factor YidD [Jiangellaceae bacterium]|nr:membrane protein insertion efficiency factor YidD [Jiangellaceae bacterium]
MTRLLVVLLKAYRMFISPLYGQVCRYYPSCSAYALGAVQTHGALRGSWLAIRRLARCHPWTPGGVDLVPPRGSYRWWGLVPGMDGSSAAESSAGDVPTEASRRSTVLTAGGA